MDGTVRNVCGRFLRARIHLVRSICRRFLHARAEAFAIAFYAHAPCEKCLLSLSVQRVLYRCYCCDMVKLVTWVILRCGLIDVFTSPALVCRKRS